MLGVSKRGMLRETWINLVSGGDVVMALNHAKRQPYEAPKGMEKKQKDKTASTERCGTFSLERNEKALVEVVEIKKDCGGDPTCKGSMYDVRVFDDDIGTTRIMCNVKFESLEAPIEPVGPLSENDPIVGEDILVRVEANQALPISVAPARVTKVLDDTHVKVTLGYFQKGRLSRRLELTPDGSSVKMLSNQLITEEIGSTVKLKASGGTVLKGKVKEHICEEGKPPMLRVELIGEKGHKIYKVPATTYDATKTAMKSKYKAFDEIWFKARGESGKVTLNRGFVCAVVVPESKGAKQVLEVQLSHFIDAGSCDEDDTYLIDEDNVIPFMLGDIVRVSNDAIHHYHCVSEKGCNERGLGSIEDAHIDYQEDGTGKLVYDVRVSENIDVVFVDQNTGEFMTNVLLRNIDEADIQAAGKAFGDQKEYFACVNGLKHKVFFLISKCFSGSLNVRFVYITQQNVCHKFSCVLINKHYVNILGNSDIVYQFSSTIFLVINVCIFNAS
jgi:hypothetical protein